VFGLPEGENLEVTVKNKLPGGTVILDDARMNAVGQELNVNSGNFTDGNGDNFVIENITKATDDNNKTFGGTLGYNGANAPYNADSDGTYTYSADASLPGYVGEDDFAVKLWDGQRTYYADGTSKVLATDYGTGTIDLNVTNELPESDAWFGQVHMDSENVTKDLAIAFGNDVIVEDGSYTGSVIGSTLYGGTLVYDGTNWTYSADTDLPGYVGDDNDQYGIAGYVADDLFTINLSSSAGQQYDYWFSDAPAPEGYELFEPAGLYRKAVSGTGTVSVDLINETPIVIDSDITRHMNNGISDQGLAKDVVDGLGILDAITLYDMFGNPLSHGDTITLDSGIVTVVAHETDGKITSYSFDFAPKDGYVGGPVSFKVKVSDGEKIYAFDNTTGEIKSAVDVFDDGTVAITLTNTLPTFSGNLGNIHMNTPVTGIDLLSYANDIDGDSLYVLVGGQPVALADFIKGNNIDASKITYDGTHWNYTPADGYVGPESFTVVVWDGQYQYVDGVKGDRVSNSGSLTVNMTNTLPTFSGNLGNIHMNTPVTGIDLLSYANDIDGDSLYVLVGGQPVALADFIKGNNIDASKITYDGTHWNYTPADGYVGPESFTVVVWDGQYQYVDGVKGDRVSNSGSLTVNMTNTLPTFSGNLGNIHMNTPVTGIDLLSYANDIDGDSLYVLVGGQPVALADFIKGNNIDASKITYDGTHWNYTPADGYVGPESFTVVVWDGQYQYVDGVKGDRVSNSGSLTVNMTNNKPSAQGNLGSVDADNTPLITNQIGNTPVTITDLWDAQQENDDQLSIIPGTYSGSFGGTLVFDGTKWTYTPTNGFTGTETFDILVWDGENIYINGSNTGPAYGAGQVTVAVTTTPTPEPTPTTAIASLPVLELPKYQGCPVEMQAVANELDVSSDSLQIMFYNALASNPNIQPCDACANLMSAATVLSDIDGTRLAAMNQIFNQIAPPDAPFTPEANASIQTAFAQNPEDPQYALAAEYAEAFVRYVAVLNELKTPLGDNVAFALEKHGTALTGGDVNPNITTYIMSQLIPGGEL
jgi:hypothetical protein